MWLLQGPKGAVYYLFPGKEHIVGRKDADILLADDQSISRKHASFKVEHRSENWNNPQKYPVVTLIECASKYGTAVNKSVQEGKMPTKSELVLNDGDCIQFGLQWNLWKLSYQPLVVGVSALIAEEKKKVKAIIGNLGGHVVDFWSEKCTHLTMNTVTLTVKAICALAHCKPIVLPVMWEEYSSCVHEQKPLPLYTNYIPPLGETIINKNEVTFEINEERKKLFEGKTFYFFSNMQLKQHECLVSCAGGTAKCLHFGKCSKEELLENTVVVIQHHVDRSTQDSEISETVKDCINFLQLNGRRLIPISEIGLAILHCSVLKYCNPDFSFASAVLGGNKKSNLNDDSEPALAVDTQEALQICTNGKQKVTPKGLVIPESGNLSRCKYLPGNSSKNNDIASSETSDLFVDTWHATGSTGHLKLESTLSKKRRKNNLGSLTSVRVKKEDDSDSEDIFGFTADKKRKITADENEDLFAFIDDHIPNSCSFEQANEEIKTEDLDTQPLQLNNESKKRKLSLNDFPEDSPATKKHSSYNTVVRSSKPDIDCTSLQDTVKVDSNIQITFSDNTASTKISRVNTAEEFLSNDKPEAKLDLPKNAAMNNTIVLMKDLVVSQNISRSGKKPENLEHNSFLKNFKKFRKSLPAFQRIPHIIGGEDMEIVDCNSKATSNFFNSKLEDNHDEDIENDDVEDDWAFQTSQVTKRKTQRLR